MAYQYRRSLTITGNVSLLPSTQTNFPVLVKLIDATMKTVANGGHIQNSGNSASGPTVTMPYDLIFTSDLAGSTNIPWEVDFYDGTNGILWAWVKIASCALSTVFYMSYGDAAVNSAQNTGLFTPANVWDSSYQAVYHLANGTVLNLADSSTNTFTLTNNNAATAATGQVDGCVALASASSQFLSRSTGWTMPIAVTIHAWVKNVTFPNAYNTVTGIHPVAPSNDFADLHIKSTAKLAMYVHVVGGGGATVSYDGTGVNTLSAGVWYHLVLTYSSAVGLIGYVNAGVDGTGAANGNISNGSVNILEIGQETPFTPRFVNGSIDEVRISTIARSADWTKSEYNSQLDPATFVVVGSEVGLLGVSIEDHIMLGLATGVTIREVTIGGFN